MTARGTISAEMEVVQQLQWNEAWPGSLSAHALTKTFEEVSYRVQAVFVNT